MADDIKLVIKISEMIYKKLKWLCESDIGIDSLTDRAIANGIPLTESDDYVSRKAVLDVFGDIHPLDYNTKAYISQIKSLPSVTPIYYYNYGVKMESAIKTLEQEQKTGHWIDKRYNFDRCSAKCSICGKPASGRSKDTGFGFTYSFTDYCPNCGAKMESEVNNDKT